METGGATAGLEQLDEPAARQSDASVVELQLRAVSKQSSGRGAARAKRVTEPGNTGKVVDAWIKDLADLHRSRPPPTVQYAKPMPDIDQLMQAGSAK